MREAEEREIRTGMCSRRLRPEGFENRTQYNKTYWLGEKGRPFQKQICFNFPHFAQRAAEMLAPFMSSRNSDAGSTAVISRWSRARVQAT